MSKLDLAALSDLVDSAASPGGLFTAELLMDSDNVWKRTVVLRPLSDERLAAMGHKLGGVDLRSSAMRNGKLTEQRITNEQWLARKVQAVAVAYAESGGVTNARCYNVDGPDGRPTCNPRPPAGPRGTDRGLYQFNDKAWPMIPDAAADNPQTAVRLVSVITDGFRDWGPWSGSKGLDPSSAPFKAALAQFENELGEAIPKGIFGLPGEEQLYDAASSVWGTVIGWAEALGKLLSVLISPTFWRRIGLGALGFILAAYALVSITR